MASEEPRVAEEEEEEDDDDDDTADFPPPAAATTGSRSRQRASVSAEAFGDWNKRGAFTPPVYPKSPEQEHELTCVVSRSFLFNALEPKDLQVIVLAMKGPLSVEPGVQFITEGDPGDHLYVITDGALHCTKVLGGVNTVVKTCLKGDLFGELALLYNSVRAASVVARDSSIVWELDRETFNNIVMEAVQRKRSQCSDTLRRMQLFASMSEGELQNIVDALKMETYQQGAVIIQQGEMGDNFYIVYEGEVIAQKVVEGQEPTQMVNKTGDYFGELALIRSEPRAASVYASSPEVRLLSMDAATFKRLMGPVEEIMHKQAQKYA